MNMPVSRKKRRNPPPGTSIRKDGKERVVYVRAAVGADAHIGPCTASRIRRSLIQKQWVPLRADVGIGPYDRFCDKRSFPDDFCREGE